MAANAQGWVARDLTIYISFLTILTLMHAQTSDAAPWLLYPALFVAFVLTYALVYIAHEWGHWLGAVTLAGRMPFAPYKGILIGYFDPAIHSRTQFLAMSWGGVAGYLTVSTLAVLSYGRAPSPITAAIATAGFAFTIQSLAVDLPQIVKVHAGADPAQTLRTGTRSGLILKRTAQTWIPLALILYLWNLQT